MFEILYDFSVFILFFFLVITREAYFNKKSYHLSIHMKLKAAFSTVLFFILLLQASADVNTQLVGVKEGDSFEFKVTVYGEIPYLHPPFNTNQTLTIKVTGSPNSTDDLPVSITYENGTVKQSSVNLKGYGSAFIYTDWEYWSVKSHLWNIEDEVSITDKNNEFVVHIHENSSTYNLDYVTSYRKGDGSLLLSNWTDTTTVTGIADTHMEFIMKICNLIQT